MLFFSGSAVEGFRAASGASADHILPVPKRPRFIAIGSSAHKALGQLDLPCNMMIAMPKDPNIFRSLIGALNELI